MKFISIALLTTPLIVLGGCEKSSDGEQRKSPIESTTKTPGKHFADHFADAGKFLDLKHAGDEYREQGKYNEAIAAYSQALEDHAYSRPEQAIALDHIAMTYEVMGDLKNAADNYEWASEVTMNETRQKSLKAKADTLRQKLSLQPLT